jgi:hypothetical protein
MNAAGMIVALRQVSGVLNMPLYNSLVTDDKVGISEFYGTRHHLVGLIEALENVHSEKLEALVAEHNKELTAYLEKFNAIGQQDPLGGFRIAQAMAGHITTIMNSAGIRDESGIRGIRR